MLFAEAIVDGLPFWAADFTVRDGNARQHVCPAAVAETVTVCRISR
jgi:hypothetical protein